FNLQPSEFAKIAALIAVAGLTVEWRRGKLTDGDFIKRVLIFAGVPALLVMFQPDLGTALALVIGVGIVLFLGGIPMGWIGAVVGFVGVLGVVGIMAEPYRMQRVVAFMDPFADPLGKGYQTVQALLAFGTGNVTGLGLGMSRQKFFYLPEAHTDFIFAIIGEEAGLIGAISIVIAFAVFLYAGVRIAIGARDSFGSLLAGGLTGMIGVQAVMNMAAVTSMMPVTGKPMPFVSYGGSSMIVTLGCVGLILSVSRFGGKAPRAVKTPRPAREKTPREGLDERRRNGRAHLPGARRGSGSRKRA
ncbi:MAG: cell division protein FtsW, partial [Coriobacteriales bacterium]|nr:cell division protein FtsW [Coriobacteriales bacterium]